MPQPTIARIETGARQPGADLLDRLLAACGYRLALEPLPGAGIDRSQIRRLLALTPAERLRLAVEEARNLEALERRLGDDTEVEILSAHAEESGE